MKLFFQRFSLIVVMAVLSSVGLFAQVNIDAASYTTLKGAFDAINAGTHQGDVVVQITANTTETATAVLKASGIGAASYNSVTIFPTATATISGSVANALIELQDADYVTIDGRINQTGILNSLTLQNNTSSSASVVRGTSPTGGNGPKNIALRYINFVGGSASTLSVTGILVGSATSLTSGGAGIENWTITNNKFRKAYYGIRFIGLSTGLATGLNVSDNNFGNNATALEGTPYAIYGTYTSNFTVSGNFIKSNNGSTTTYAIYALNSTNLVITNNILRDISNSSSGYGIAIESSTSAIVSNNTIENLLFSSTTAAIQLGSSTVSCIVKNNKINNIRSYSTSGYGAYGINITAGNNHEIYNNAISDITSTNYSASNNYECPIGIRVNAGTGTKIYYNSVNLFGTQSGTNTSASKSACLSLGTTSVTGLDVRNNVFSNTLAGVTGTKAYSIYLTGTDNLTGSTFDYNDLYAAGNNPVFAYLGADVLDLAAWKLATSQSNNTISANPTFNSNTNLVPLAGSPLLMAGTRIVGYETDLKGENRDGSTPTIGAYEAAGDFNPPTVTFTALGNTSSLANRTLSATITDDNGVNTTANAPRIYYKKVVNANAFVDNTNATDGWKYTVATGTAPNFTFTLDYSLLNGGVAAGNQIMYFVVAQDNSSNLNLRLPTGVFAVTPTSVDLNAANFPVTGIANSYVLSISYTGTIEVGAGKAFTTLTDATGLFNALNNGVVLGNLTVNITSDLTETGTVALNQLAEEGGTGFTMTIKPFETAKTVTFNKAGACLQLNQADRITIDGRIAGVGNNLTFINTNTSSTALIDIAGSATNGATNNTIRNCNLVNGSNTSSSSSAILVRDIAGTSTVNAMNHNISILENTFKKSYSAINVLGAGINGLMIQKNIIGDAVAANTVTVRGIAVTGANAPSIMGNNIFNMFYTSSPNLAAIELNGIVADAMIANNIITGLSNQSTGGYGAYGININASTITNTTIANNMLSNFSSFGWNQTSTSDNDFGIRLTGGTGFNIYNNTINMAGTIPTNTQSPRNSAIGVTDALVAGVTLRNNILINATTNSTATSKSVIFWVPTAWTGVTFADYNHYFNGGNYPSFGFVGTTEAATFDAWKTLTSTGTNSTYGPVAFTAHNNPIIDGASITDAMLIKPTFTGMPAMDIHGEVRTAANNLAGADIAIPLSIAIATDLPATIKKGSNASYNMTFVPQLGTNFADGITRTPPAGHMAGMTYEWYQNSVLVVTGVNDVVLNNNVMELQLINPTHAGNYYAKVMISGLMAQTSLCSLEVETLEPTLEYPANLVADLPLNITLTWIAALDATDYTIQFSTDATFASNVIELNTVNTSYTPAMLEYLTTYYWRVKGFNTQNTSSWTATRSFTTRPAIHAVALIAPADTLTSAALAQTFTWGTDVDATSYEYQISTSATFATTFATGVITGTSYADTLEYETTYFWRVRGVNATHNGVWSTTRTLTTRPAIFPVVLLSPANAATGMNVNLTFVWQANVDATNYQFELATNSTFTNKLESINLTGTSHTYNGLALGATYYWRVKGSNNTYQAAWSEVRSFTVTATPFTAFAIGNGTFGSYSYPMNRFYNYSVSNSIYLQSEMGTAKTLNLIGYYKGGGTNVSPIDAVQIYLRHTTDATLATGTYDVANYTLVYSGQFTNNALTGWMMVPFTTTFAYNGTSNLEVLIVKGFQTYTSTSAESPIWKYSTVSTIRHRYAYSDGSLPTSLTSTTTNLPDPAFGFVNTALTTPVLTSPLANAEDVYVNHNFTWNAVNGASMYRVQVSTSPTFATFVENKVVTTNSATFTNLLYTTEHHWRVQAINAYNVSSWSAVNSFTTTPQILYGTYRVGTGTNANFANLTEVFNTLNNGAYMAADVTLEIISDIVEPATASLNQPMEYFDGGYTMTIRPDGNTLRTISANAPNSAVIKLVGADRVIIDGKANASSQVHKLHIQNTSEGESVALWIASTNGDFEGCDDVQVLNTILSTKTSDINLLSSAGIFSGSTNAIGATPVLANSNTIIDNNIFLRAKRGALLQGHSVNKPAGIMITNNTFGSEEFDNLLYSGIEMYNLNAPHIENNKIINSQNYGINLNGSPAAEVENNQIYTTNLDLYPGSVYGMNITNSANAEIKDNIVKHFKTYGMFIQSSSNIKIEHNSLSNTGLLSNALTQVTGIYLTSNANQGLTVKGNKIFDINSTYYSTTANGAAYGISINTSTVNTVNTPINIENNMIWNISGFGSTNPNYLQNNPMGIIIGTGKYIHLYNNSVVMNGALNSGNGISACVYANNAGVTNVDMRNNLFVNKMQSTASATNYIYFINSIATFENINNNIISLTGVQNGKVAMLSNVAYTSLSMWQTASMMDAASKMKAVPFIAGLPYLASSILMDTDYFSPNLLSTMDINGTVRTTTNNVVGAYIPLNNNVQARYATFSNITTNAMNMAWINGNGQGRLVLATTENLSANEWMEVIQNLNTNVGEYSALSGNWSSKIAVRYGSSTAYVLDELAGSSRTATINGLTPSTKYYFHVVEYYTNGTEVAYNQFPSTLNPRSIETLFDVTAPVVAPATNVAYDMFSANWNYTTAQRFDGFELSINGDIFDVGMISNAANAYHFDNFATPNAAYTYKVRAKKGGLTGDWSAEQMVNTYPMTVINGSATACATTPLTYTMTTGNTVVNTVLWSSLGPVTFTPSTGEVSATWAMDGTYDLTAFITDNYGNTGTVSKNVLVNPLPIMLAPANFEVCLTAQAFALAGATPVGGMYSGTGVAAGMFDPAIAGIGAHVITYTYTNSATSCVNTCQFTINVMNAITVTAPANFNVCLDTPELALTGATPVNGTNAGVGTYTGVGVAAGMFNPAVAGLGTHVITYTFNDQYGCSNFATFEILVTSVPVLTVPANSAVCLNSAAVELIATPTGGTFSGTGVSGTTFVPSTVGAHTITYFYSDSYGCSNSETFVIAVDPIPVVTVADVVLCIDAGATPLVANMMGGTFAGAGIDLGVFTPTTAGVFPATYTYIQGACTVVVDFEITVNPLPVLTAPANFAVCVDAAAVTLTGALPIDGEYSGAGVDAGVFTPATAGVGPHVITYSYTDSKSCVNTTTFTITVNPLPVLTAPANFAVCVNASPVTLTGALPVGGTYSGVGVSVGMFNPATAGVGEHIITYTYSDANTCMNTTTFTITVNPLPVLTVENSTVCISVAPYTLSSASPAGGNYSGVGVSNNMFSPVLAGAGVHTITYTYLDANTCTTAATFEITVTAAPAFTLQPQSMWVAMDSTATFTAATAVPTDTYQWEYSTNAGTTWEQIAGETTTTLVVANATNPMNNHQYRLVATGCTSTNSAVATLNVLDRPQDQARYINWLTWSRYQLTFNWAAGSGTGRIVVATKAANWPLTNNFIPTDNVDYTAFVNSDFSLATPIMVGGVDYRVVYNGTATGPLSVIGLERSQTYALHVFEYNKVGSIILYNTSSTMQNNPNARSTSRKDGMFDSEDQIAQGIFQLGKVWPNPASSNLSFSINVEKAGRFTIELVNMLGETVYSNDMNLEVGEFPMNIKLSSERGSMPSGSYILRVSTNGASLNQSVVVIQ